MRNCGILDDHCSSNSSSELQERTTIPCKLHISQKLLLMRVGPEGTDGAVSDVEIPAALDGDPGRLRGVYAVPGGPLLVTTSNGDDDRILRIDPS